MISFSIDIILAAIAVIIIVAGWRKGVVKGILSLATSIVAAVVAYAFTPKLSALIYDNLILQKISSGIEQTVGSLAKSGDGYDFGKLISEMPEVFSNVLTKYGVSAESVEKLNSQMTETGEAALEKVSNFIASPVATVISNVISFILIFIVALIVLKLCAKIITAIFKAPILKNADRFAGLIFGIVNAAVVLWILSLVVSHGVSALGSVAPDWFGDKVVDNSLILKTFSHFNPLKVIDGVISYLG